MNQRARSWFFTWFRKFINGTMSIKTGGWITTPNLLEGIRILEIPASIDSGGKSRRNHVNNIYIIILSSRLASKSSKKVPPTSSFQNLSLSMMSLEEYIIETPPVRSSFASDTVNHPPESGNHHVIWSTLSLLTEPKSLLTCPISKSIILFRRGERVYHAPLSPR